LQNKDTEAEEAIVHANFTVLMHSKFRSFSTLRAVLYKDMGLFTMMTLSVTEYFQKLYSWLMFLWSWYGGHLDIILSGYYVCMIYSVRTEIRTRLKWEKRALTPQCGLPSL
jgi:hypothetical protein